jgi:hypothetical protein
VADGDLLRIFQALERSGVRYLVVGGVAVVLHGHPRFTADLDLVVALDRENVLRAIEALGTLGYRPRAPVPAHDLADPDARRVWIDEKGLTVFSLWSSVLPATEVDIFVAEPFPFEEAFSRGVRVEVGGATLVVVGLEDLVAMKRGAGRAKDLDDVAALEALAKETGDV